MRSLEKLEGKIQEAKGGSGAKDKTADELLKSQGAGKLHTVAAFAVLLLVPAAILVYRGVTDREECGDGQSKCLSKCAELYGDPTRIFQSQFQGERNCEARCTVKADDCRSRGITIILGGLLLCAGLVISCFLVFALESIMRRFGGGAGAGAGPSTKIRAAYSEPTFTEDEVRSLRSGRSGGVRGWFSRRTAEVDLPTVEARCLDCDVPVNVDDRWLTGTRGGMDGAICPRCRKIVLGVL